MNQADLGLRLGVGQSRITRIERDPSAISLAQLLSMLNAVGVELVLRMDEEMTDGRDVWPRMLAMAEQVPAMLGTVEQQLPEDFPPTTWEPIAAGMRRHATQFLDESATDLIAT